MKKRICATFLALSLIMSLLPASALAAELGEDQPQVPVCTCKTLCAEGTVNEQCAVCMANTAACTGKDPQLEVPKCNCETRCTDGAVNELCPLCMGDLSVCAGTATPEVPETPTPPVEPQTPEVPQLPVEPQIPEVPEIPEPPVEPVPLADNFIYVSSSGDDANEGSEDAPYATLQHAVDEAPDGATIYVMTDLTIRKLARVTDKHVTITSADPENPVKLIRGSVQASDTNQSHYNSAMIEVTTNGLDDNENASSVTLTNIILTDEGQHDGTYFAQTNTKTISTSNLDFVQDSMVTAHGKINRAVSITLGNGAVLEDYGGMSAVYGTMNAHITMKLGSSIVAPGVTDRVKSATPHKDETGAAGAVWLQSAEFIMDSGAKICNMVGRAVYADGGKVTINGTISNITDDDDMWWAGEGIAVHGRASAEIDLTDSSLVEKIYDEDKQGDSDRVIYGTGAKLTVAGIVQNCYAKNIVYAAGGRDSKACTISGTVQSNMSDGDNGYTIVSEGTDLTISGTAQIFENKAGISTVYAAAGSKIDLYGHIDKNIGGQCGGIFMYGNYSGGRDITVDMYEGATLDGNKRDNSYFHYSNWSNILKDRGGAVCSGGSTHGHKTIFTIHGGTISNNTSGYGALFIRKNGEAVIDGTGKITNNNGYGVYVESEAGMPKSSLIMAGGTIEENTQDGIYYRASYENYIKINGGTIKNNGTDSQISVIGGSAKDANENIYIAPSVLQEKTAVKTSLGTVTLDQGYRAVSLGNASSAASDQIKSEIAADPQYSGWIVAGSSALWIKPEDATQPYHFTITRPSSAKKTSLFAAYLPLTAEGTPLDGAKVTVTKVKNDAVIDVTLPPLPEGASAYAAMFVNNKEYTLRPDDITIYTGGGQNEENYEHGGLPKLTLNNCVDLNYQNKLTSLEIDGQNVAAEDLMTELLKLFNVTYTDENGKTITNDKTPGAYIAKLTWADGPKTLKINGNDVKDILETGTLIIRHTEDQEEAEEGTNTYPLLDSDTPEKPVTHAEAFANKRYSLDPKFYINGDDTRQITNIAGISLLDDSLLLEHENDNRQQLMEKKALGILDPIDATKAYAFDFHYLDLVDAFNGNAWVSASYGTTVYLPYPAGTNSETNFTLIHYKDLHREYGISGQANVEQAINDCELEKVVVTNTDYGIQFDVEESGFSPFALVWTVNAHTITATAGPGGSIDPSGTVTVGDGMGKYFTITPDTGYRISDVKVDDISVGAVSSYNFTNVTEDRTISATFAKDSSGGGTSTPNDYTLHYVTNGGKHLSTETKNHSWIKAYEDLPVPVRKGYTFAGWYWDLRLTNPVRGDVKVDKATVDLYAKWEANGAWTGSGDVSAWLDTVNHKAFLSGYPDGTFGTDRNMTRAEVAQMFYSLLLDKDVKITKTFTDVPADAWYADAVNTLASLGMLGGYPDGTFQPNRTITRAEFAVVALAFTDGGNDASCSFTDVSRNDWFYKYAAQASEYGWIGGYPDGSFRPNNKITRAEVSVIVNNMLGRVADQRHIDRNADELTAFADLTGGHWAYYAIMEATNTHTYIQDGGTEVWKTIA